jgi:hypothetical protein
VALASRDIGLLVERGAGLRARFLDGYETVPWPVYWLAYQEGGQEGAPEGEAADRQSGVLRYCGAGPDERIHDYEIDRVDVLGPDVVIFHVRDATSVAAFILDTCLSADARQTLYVWDRAVRRSNQYPDAGWRFGGTRPGNPQG